MNKGRRIVCVAALFLYLMTGAQGLIGLTSHARSQNDRSQANGPFVSGRVLVQFRPETTLSRAQRLIAQAGAHDAGEIPSIGVHIVELPDGADEEAFVHTFKSKPEIEFAELDRIFAPDAMTPNDPSYPSEWHLPKIAAPNAWSSTTGSSSVIIAILDTGVDSTHPELSPKIIQGWNFYDNNSDTRDVYGHGTAVAGSAAAASNNGMGVASVAWNCMLMPIRISDLNGYGSTSAMANGLTWAADHGARVANISYRVSTSSTVSSAARYFGSKGGVVTISAGNETSFDSTPDNPDVITVSATTSSDTLASWSNTGNNIDLASPGVSISTTNRGGGYGSWSGTSFSAPIVAGVAALVISANPSLTGSQIQDVLKQSADNLGAAGWDTQYGWGRVNAANAVTLATGNPPPPPPPDVDTMPPTISITSPVEGVTVSGTTVSVLVNARDDRAVAKVELYVDGVLKATSTSSPFTTKWNVRKASAGSHPLQCKAYDAAGNVGASTMVTVYK
jgi:thermitase